MGQIKFHPREVLSIIGGAVLRQRLGAAGQAARVVRQGVLAFQRTLERYEIGEECSGEGFTSILMEALEVALAQTAIPRPLAATLIADLTPQNIADIIATEDGMDYLERQLEQFLEAQPDHALSAYPVMDLVGQLRRAYSRRLRSRPQLPGLVGLDFRGANLTNTDLSEANLSRACFANAILIYADLTGSYLTDGDLFGANFSGARLTGARLYGVNALGVDFSGAELNLARLNGARLIGVHFNGAKLVGADLSGASLVESIFADTDLTDADLIGADLGGADLTNADLTNANLSGANLSGTILPDGWRSRSNARQIEHLRELGIPGLKI